MSDSRPRRNEALRESEERYRVLFDLSPVAVYSIDASGVIQEFNRVAAELWGREPALGDTDERFCGSFKLFRPDGSFMPHEQCPMAQVVSGEISEARDAEVLIERPDGSRVTVIVNIRPLKGPNGEITGAINCFYDITERFRIERERQQQADALADLNRRKDEFLAMLSHELRNPLAPIVNAVHLLGVQPNGDPLQERARSIIERQVTQLTRLVDDLMDVSRVSTGRVHLQLDYVAMSGVVERAVEAIRHLIDERGHELTVSLPPQPIWLHADAARLEQIVVNLLTNAAKYTEHGGHIWLSVEQEGDECVLRVRDTGIGIAPELLPRVFDLFTQAERSLARSQGGLGIGLALVQRLVEMHQGRVEAHSTLGQGSEFVVTLPVARSSGVQPPAALPETNQSATRSLRVLVVDDNVDTVESLAMLMNALGHDVRKAYDGSASLEAALEYRPHIMLLDIGLPGLDGYQLATRIREQAALQDVVLVALTGYGQESARQRSLEAGFDHHLTKPADLNEIEANPGDRFVEAREVQVRSLQSSPICIGNKPAFSTKHNKFAMRASYSPRTPQGGIVRYVRVERFELALAVADDDTDLGDAAIAHFAHNQVHPPYSDEVADHTPAMELLVDVLGERLRLHPLRNLDAVDFRHLAERRIPVQRESAKDALLLGFLGVVRRDEQVVEQPHVFVRGDDVRPDLLRRFPIG